VRISEIDVLSTKAQLCLSAALDKNVPCFMSSQKVTKMTKGIDGRRFAFRAGREFGDRGRLWIGPRNADTRESSLRVLENAVNFYSARARDGFAHIQIGDNVRSRDSLFGNLALRLP
jgi:hypothetical protein